MRTHPYYVKATPVAPGHEIHSFEVYDKRTGEPDGIVFWYKYQAYNHAKELAKSPPPQNAASSPVQE